VIDSFVPIVSVLQENQDEKITSNEKYRGMQINQWEPMCQRYPDRMEVLISIAKMHFLSLAKAQEFYMRGGGGCIRMERYKIY